MVLFFKKGLLASLVAFSIAGLASAQTPAVRVDGAWARATAPGQTTGVVYMSLTSAAGDTLTGVESLDASMAMLHRTVRGGGMSGMEDMDALVLPAGKTVALAPNGTHIMLMDLKHALTQGGTVDVTLHFAKAGSEHALVPVQPITAHGPPG